MNVLATLAAIIACVFYASTATLMAIDIMMHGTPSDPQERSWLLAIVLGLGWPIPAGFACALVILKVLRDANRPSPSTTAQEEPIDG